MTALPHEDGVMCISRFRDQRNDLNARLRSKCPGITATQGSLCSDTQLQMRLGQRWSRMQYETKVLIDTFVLT